MFRSNRTLSSFVCISFPSVLLAAVAAFWSDEARVAREAAERKRRMTERVERIGEAAAQAARQRKKLEFLLSQTELFSHFIGRKMGVESSPAPGGDGNGGDSDDDAAADALLVPADGDTDAEAQRKAAARAELAERRAERRRERLEVQAAAQAKVREAAGKRREFDAAVAVAKAKARRKRRDRLDTQRARVAERVAYLRAAAAEAGESFDEASVEKTEYSAFVAEDCDDDDDDDDGDGDENAVVRDGGELDLLSPSTMPTAEETIEPPPLFAGTLKAYQLKGFNWLANLYEQGINGILADEMGLGKTVQTIAFLAHLAATKNVWGPFIIVAPVSTLHQWYNEVTKFCPAFKCLPYWGTAKDRKMVRTLWDTSRLHRKDANFHVLVTSYHVVLSDSAYFSRVKWAHMVLDEAHALKNANSQRWQKLLAVKCRSRLLLTGTPIQNNMHELWALLHFIMPEFFDSHAEFNEWFAKGVTQLAEGEGASGSGGGGGGGGRDMRSEMTRLDSHQLRRLHLILKPFMLRRVKNDVMNGR
jgi:DNA helicase INO80